MAPVPNDFAAELVRNGDPRQHGAESLAILRRDDQRSATLDPVDNDRVALFVEDDLDPSSRHRKSAVLGRVGCEFMQQEREAVNSGAGNLNVNSRDRDARILRFVEGGDDRADDGRAD